MGNILERSLINIEVLLWMDNVVVGIYRQINHKFFNFI